MKAAISGILKYLLVPGMLWPTTRRAVDRLWTQQWPTLQNSTQATILFLVSFAAFSCAYYTLLFWWQLSPVRRTSWLRGLYCHEPATDISRHWITRRRVCTYCLCHGPEAIVYPLHDPADNGDWHCSGCNNSFKDERWKKALRERAAKAEADRIAQKKGNPNFGSCG